MNQGNKNYCEKATEWISTMKNTVVTWDGTMDLHWCKKDSCENRNQTNEQNTQTEASGSATDSANSRSAGCSGNQSASSKKHGISSKKHLEMSLLSLAVSGMVLTAAMLMGCCCKCSHKS